MTAQSGLGFSGIAAIQIPDRGEFNQRLAKQTTQNYDYDWEDPSTTSNPFDVLYLKGDETTDGSIRLIVDTLSDTATIEVRADGVWNLGELLLAQGSLNLGRDIRLSAAGHHVLVTDLVVPEQLFLLEVPYDDTGTGFPRTQIMTEKLIRRIQQPDNSGALTVATHTASIAAVNEVLTTLLYLQTGATAASAEASLVLTAGVPPNDVVFFQKNFPASQFPANSEIQIEMAPGVEFDPGEQINITLSSANAFTILYDSTLTIPWFALDFQQLGHEDLLTETLVLSNDLSLTFSNDLELARPNFDLVLL